MSSKENAFSTFFLTDNENSMDGFDRLELAMERAGLTRKAVALELGFNVSNFASWKIRRDLPKAEVLVGICRLCGVTVEWVVDEKDSTDPWIREHRELITDLKALRPDQLATLAAVARVQAEANGAEPARKLPDFEAGVRLAQQKAREQKGVKTES